MVTTIVVQTLGFSNLALGSVCWAFVKPNHLASQLTSRTPFSLTIGSGFKVGQPLGLIGVVRHVVEHGYRELVASVGEHSGNGGSTRGALAYEMNVFARIARIIRSYVEQFLGSWEDLERIIDQVVTEMNTNLVKLRQTTVQLTYNLNTF